MFLVFRGNFVFEDSRQMTQQDFKASAEAIGRIQARVDERKLKAEADKLNKRELRKRKNRIISSSDDNIDLEGLMEESNKKRKTSDNMQNKTAPCSVNLTRLDDVLSDELANQNKTLDNDAVVNEEPASQLNTEPADPKPKPAQPSVKPKHKNNNRNIASQVTKEPSHPVSSEKPRTRNNMRNNSACTSVAAKIIKKAKSCRDGSWIKVTEGAKKKKKLEECYVKCPSKGCTKVRTTKRAIRIHLKEKHPDFYWRCTYVNCRKKYRTREGRYKHELVHKVGHRFECKKCEYRCMFESELADHKRKHTRRNMFTCRVDPHCLKDYPAKRTRNAHEKTHTAQDWTCASIDEDGNVCSQECVSKAHLAQHIRGAHGKGWDTRCGKNYSWPSLKYKHEKECDQCIAAKKFARKKKALK